MMNAPIKHYCNVAIGHPFHEPYHHHHYGFPITDESALFERLVLEINQAGLSWLTILKKQEAFRVAYANFNIDIVSAFTETDRARLLLDVGIIRNRLKINAAIENARRLIAMRSSHRGFYDWLMANHPLVKSDWVRLFKKSFVFTGEEITGEFLMSIGLLPGAHHPNCPIYQRLATMTPPPPWMMVTQKKSNFYH